MGALLDIGEVRSRTGLAASALHYYERHGLIASVERVGLRRQYEPETVDRVAVIVLCQRAGFRLDEIGELLATGGSAAWRDLVGAKLAEVRARRRELETIEEGLLHALDCPSDDVLRCEHFRAELRAVVPVEGRDRARRPRPGGWVGWGAPAPPAGSGPA